MAQVLLIAAVGAGFILVRRWLRREQERVAADLRAAMTQGLETGDSDLTLDIATQLWLFWAAPILGGILGATIHNWMVAGEEE